MCGRFSLYFIFRTDRKLLAFAGLWERWERGGQTIESCTIIVTSANDTTRPIHERMPVILDRKDYDRWLFTSFEVALQDLLVPCPVHWLKCHPVAERVGNVRNDDEQLIQPAPVNGLLWE